MDSNSIFDQLQQFKGELLTDEHSKIIYSTDASVYYEKPMAIAIPQDEKDIELLIKFACNNKITLIPRAAGTSLAGQVVGSGLIVDISKHFTNIINLNIEEKWVKVQPGVILDELNRYLAKNKLFFGPETSTSNRCTIGGMVGNNACGLHAVIYGTTRDHLLEVSGYLSDGSKVEFKPLTKEEFEQKCNGDLLENRIYKNLKETLSKKDNQKAIIDNYPEKRLIRRNNGYALDQLLYNEVFNDSKEKINIAKLIAGSEGTLMFITEVKLNLVPSPAQNKALICAHFETINQALKANIVALKHKVTAVELMDDIILNAASKNIEQLKNRFFIKGNPKGLLLIELVDENIEKLEQNVTLLINDLTKEKLGFHYPILYNEDTKKAWNLRKAGLGIMANIPGDKKSVTVIEDTAVHPEVLPDYIDEFSLIMKKYGEECVYHAHAGTGEIHLRPRLNLKDEEEIKTFKNIAWDIAKLVKKYRGSLSGEHGDGRLRGEFIPFMLGEQVYQLLKNLKNTWDPNHIFNAGKIIDTPPMYSNLRYKTGETKQISTYFDFSDKGGIVRATESCNGSGDCRKLETASGSMCPSFQATRDEKHVTRARANLLREFLSYSDKTNPFDHKDLYHSFDLCLSCKACKSECPSSVDVAKLKAEFLQHYYKANGIPFRTWVIANITKLYKIGAIIPLISNYVMQNKISGNLLKKTLGFSVKRSMPKIHRWHTKPALNSPATIKKETYLFIDEFTRYNEPHIAETALKLLSRLNYKVHVIDKLESGRSYLSKGLLQKAKLIANKNIITLHQNITTSTPLLGIEPSALLSFRDEYPELVSKDLREKAKQVAQHCYLVEEFLANEINEGNISSNDFTSTQKNIKIHGHCQQKSIASTAPVKQVLSLPKNYTVEEIPSGCCGMAGSFGYEKEHYDISMKIGELVLFPEIRNTTTETDIAAPGTSCRHQILDGTGRKALHPIELFYEALNKKGTD